MRTKRANRIRWEQLKHLVNESMLWRVLTPLARIHSIPLRQRAKGGRLVRRPKLDVCREIGRAMHGTFPDRMTRTCELLESHYADMHLTIPALLESHDAQPDRRTRH